MKRETNKQKIAALSSSFPQRVGQHVHHVPAQTREIEKKTNQVMKHACSRLPCFFKVKKKDETANEARGLCWAPGLFCQNHDFTQWAPGSRPAIPSFLNLPRPGGSPTATKGRLAGNSTSTDRLGNETPRAAQGRSLLLRRCKPALLLNSRTNDDGTRLHRHTQKHRHRGTHVHDVVELCTDEN